MTQNWEKEPKETVFEGKSTDESARRLAFIFVCWFSGDFHVVLNDKSCILPSLCGITDGRYALLGLNVTFTNERCETNLCNGVAKPTAPYWTDMLITLLSLCLVWWTGVQGTWTTLTLKVCLVGWKCVQKWILLLTYCTTFLWLCGTMWTIKN